MCMIDIDDHDHTSRSKFEAPYECGLHVVASRAIARISEYTYYMPYTCARVDKMLLYMSEL